MEPPWLVPEEVAAGGDVVTVARAWPGADRDGGARVTVEGRDALGRLRAGVVRRDGPAELLPSGSDPRLPALEGLDGELLVHRAGRRAVLRRAAGYTKVVRPGRSGAVATAAATGHDLARSAGLAAPEVLAHDPAAGTVTTSVLPGRSVHVLGDDRRWRSVWETWGAAWVRLQRLEGGDLPRHTAADEGGVVRGWVGRAGGAGVLPGGWAGRGAAVADRLERAGDPPHLVPTHRDLHDKQLLWDGTGLGVLDLDTACVADPALDPANLAVHADLRRAQGLWSAGAAAVVVEAARRVADEAGVDERRWRLAQQATLVRLVGVYAFRPPWRDTVLTWAEHRWAEPC